MTSRYPPMHEGVPRPARSTMLFGVNGTPGTVYVATTPTHTSTWAAVLVAVVAVLLVAALIAVIVIVAPTQRTAGRMSTVQHTVSLQHAKKDDDDDDDDNHRPPHRPPKPPKPPNNQPKPPRPPSPPSPAPPHVSPPAHCPHNGTHAPPPRSCRNHTRANLCLDDPHCPSTLDTNLACDALSTWTMHKTARTPPFFIADDPFDHVNSTNDTAAFTIHVIKHANGNFTLTGHAHLVILNDGACNRSSISSLLFILEQAGVVGASCSACGSASGGFRMWATSGAENAATAGRCNTTALAQICAAHDAPCNVSVPFEPDTVVDTSTNALLNLSEYVIGAHTTCANATIIDVNISFVVNASTWAVLKNNPRGFRITALVSYDACCDHSACGINIDCSHDGSVETIRTVHLRSLPFILNTTCDRACDCIAVSEFTPGVFWASTANTSTCEPAAVFPPEFNATQLVCNSTNISVPVTYICNMSASSCTGNGTLPVLVSNNAFFNVNATLHDSTCFHPATGTPLTEADVSTAIGGFACEFAAPVLETPSPLAPVPSVGPPLETPSPTRAPRPVPTPTPAVVPSPKPVPTPTPAVAPSPRPVPTPVPAVVPSPRPAPTPTPTVRPPTPVRVPSPVPPPAGTLPQLCTYSQEAYGKCDRRWALNQTQCAILNASSTYNVSIGFWTAFGDEDMLAVTGVPRMGNCLFRNGTAIANFLPTMNNNATLIPVTSADGNCSNASILQGQTLAAMLNAFGNASTPEIVFNATLKNCPDTFLNSFSNVSAITNLTGLNIKDIVVAASILNGQNADCAQASSPSAGLACSHLQGLSLAELTYFLDQYNKAFEKCQPCFIATCFQPAPTTA